MSISYWEENRDVLNRADEADYLLSFLVKKTALRRDRGIQSSFVINIDARWGQGKTFFLKGLQAELSGRHPCVYIDAWRDDFSNDPFTAVISELNRFAADFASEQNSVSEKLGRTLANVRKNAGRITLLAIQGGAKKISQWAIGEASGEIAELISEKASSETGKVAGSVVSEALEIITSSLIDKFAEEQVKRFDEAKESIQNFNYSFSELLSIINERISLPLFVLIDELDRCRPSYSVEMLERIKHIFNHPDVVFIVASDTKQLSHAVCSIYGASFDGQHYLSRFFEQRYVLSTPDTRSFAKFCCEKSLAGFKNFETQIRVEIEDMVVAAANCHDLELRQTGRLVDFFSNICMGWNEKAPIEFALILPMIAFHIQGGSLEGTNWTKAFTHSGPELTGDLIVNNINLQRSVEILLRNSEENISNFANRIRADERFRDPRSEFNFVYNLVNREMSFGRYEMRPLFFSYAKRIEQAGNFSEKR